MEQAGSDRSGPGRDNAPDLPTKTMATNNTNSGGQNGCAKCGQQTPRSGLCKACGRDESRNPEAQTDDKPTIDWFECRECERTFSPDGGLDPCPDCGSYRHIRVDGPGVEA